MQITIRKCFFVWDFEKEENWLNEMAAKGLVLVSVGFCKYTFEKCDAKKYQVRIELLENSPSNPKSQQYINFIEETGAEYIGSVMRLAYFRGNVENSEFNLYSDNASKIKYINRILLFISPPLMINFINISFYFVSGFKTNLIIGIICLVLNVFFIRGYIRIFQKKIKLIKNNKLFE